MRAVLRMCAAALAVVCLAPAVFGADEYRQWTSGQFKIKAQFKSVENGTVTLLQEDGEELEIELTKLSKADQDFIRDAQKKASANPFKPKTSTTPFKTKKKPSETPAPEEDDPAPSGGMRKVKADLTAADVINLAPPGEDWKVDVTPPSPAFTKPLKAAALPPKSDFFEGLKSVVVNPVAQKAVLGYTLGKRREPATTRLVICDLAGGRSLPPASEAGEMSPLALHDDGKQILMRREEFGFGNLDRLEVWSVAGKKVTKLIEWTPYDDVKGSQRDVMWAEFLDEEHLATGSRGGRVVIWKYPEIEAECVLTLADGCVPALSPDRKLIGYSNGKEVGLFDVTKREVVAQQPTPAQLQWPFMAFSPSGKKLGCIAFNQVLVWDVATGQNERTIPLTNIHGHEHIEFPDENFLLVGKKYLIDLENQLKLWTYDGAEVVASAGGWTFFGVADGNKPGALVPAQVPHAGARDLLKKALTDPNLFVLRAGTVVKLNLAGIGDATQQLAIQQALTKKLEANGCTVGPAGTIELAASVEGPKPRELRFFFGGDYTIQEYLTRVKFTYEGQPVWESAGTNVPGVVSLKRGENMEMHLRSLEKPQYQYFDHVELPKFLQKPAPGTGPNRSLTLGQSKVTAAGVR